MRRETQNILLLLLGGALLKIALTGDYLRYVKASQQPWLLTAGVVMVALAAAAITHDIRTAHTSAVERADGNVAPVATAAGKPVAVAGDPVPPSVDPPPRAEAAVPAHGDHEHGHARSAWLLLLPVLAILLVAPPALGADSVARAGNRAPAPPSSADGDNLVDFPPLPRASPFDDTLSDFTARAGWDRAHSLIGRPVRLTGFVVHEGADTYLARLVIACCAADAFPVKVKVTGGEVESLANDTWLQATVLLVPGSSTEANEWTPSATVTALRRLAEPRDAYEY